MSDKHNDLIDIAYKSLNSKFKDKGFRAFRLSDPDSPMVVKTFIPTGCTPLDIAIANKSNGGIPIGKIVGIEGLKSCVTDDTKIEVVID